MADAPDAELCSTSVTLANGAMDLIAQQPQLRLAPA
jgi:hypothetical protein